MNTTFPRSPRSRQGYNVEQVEKFLHEAKRAYTAERGEPVAVDAASVRRAAFGMQKGGYSPSHVDAALERLEDAFASRERERAFQTMGQDAWFAEIRKLKQEIIDRLGRPLGERFDRVNALTLGYNRKDVDRFGSRLARRLAEDKPISVNDLRQVTFRAQHGGYQEVQVDLLIDSAVTVILAIA